MIAGRLSADANLFSSEPRSMFFLMDVTIKQARHQLEHTFQSESIGLTTDQWLLMKIVPRHGMIPQHQLASACAKAPGTTARVLDLRSKKGLTIRQDAPSERSSFDIRLTQKGIPVYKSAQQVVLAVRKD